MSDLNEPSPEQTAVLLRRVRESRSRIRRERDTYAETVARLPEVLAVAIYPDARKADGTPSLHLSISAAVQETIEDVIADCGDNSTSVLASNIARVLASRIEAVSHG